MPRLEASLCAYTATGDFANIVWHTGVDTRVLVKFAEGIERPLCQLLWVGVGTVGGGVLGHSKAVLNQPFIHAATNRHEAFSLDGGDLRQPVLAAFDAPVEKLALDCGHGIGVDAIGQCTNKVNSNGAGVCLEAGNIVVAAACSHEDSYQQRDGYKPTHNAAAAMAAQRRRRHR